MASAYLGGHIDTHQHEHGPSCHHHGRSFSDCSDANLYPHGFAKRVEAWFERWSAKKQRNRVASLGVVALSYVICPGLCPILDDYIMPAAAVIAPAVPKHQTQLTCAEDIDRPRPRRVVGADDKEQLIIIDEDGQVVVFLRGATKQSEDTPCATHFTEDGQRLELVPVHGMDAIGLLRNMPELNAEV